MVSTGLGLPNVIVPPFSTVPLMYSVGGLKLGYIE
jgi:hypothetical protein